MDFGLIFPYPDFPREPVGGYALSGVATPRHTHAYFGLTKPEGGEQVSPKDPTWARDQVQVGNHRAQGRVVGSGVYCNGTVTVTFRAH